MELTPRKPDVPQTRRTWIWWVLAGILMAWNIWAFLPKGRPEVAIPYTTFLDQIDADNVADVTIAGDEITGSFVKPFVWPQPTPETAPAPSPQPSAKVPASPAPTATPLASPQPTTMLAASPGATAAPLASPQPKASPEATSVSSDSPISPPSQSYTDFMTNFPEAVGDPNLMPLLQAHRVEVNVTPPPSPWLGMLLTSGLPMLFLVLLLVWMGRQAAQGQGGIFSFGRSKARRYVGDRPDVTFDDVAGADEAKGELQEVVDFLRNPQKYHDIGARIPRGILLVGPPGTGKTLMARAVAGEAEVPFFSISASEFVEMFVGVGASRVRDLFKQAKEAAPAIVFIDEMDAVGRRRGAGLGTVNDEREQTLNQLLVEMDGFDERHEIIVLAATNRPDVLDPALLRPGRFDREVVVNLPDRQGREGVLRIHTRKLRLTGDVDLSLLARSTTGLSGADLANLCNEAALITARRDRTHVAMDDFEEALDKILLGGVRPLLLDERDRRVVAHHEAGHALVAWLTPKADPVHKVTIIPRGQTLGVTEQVPGEDHYNYDRSYLLARLAVMLGGRTAEEIAIGDITTGAENDLVDATRLARRMVTRWGMGGLGLVAFRTDEEQPFLGYELAQGRDYSEHTAARIDQDVQRLLEEQHATVHRVLNDARGQLDRLVQALLKEETIDQETLAQVLGPRPEPIEEV
jgi:cell division protease FtsH